VFRSTSEAVDRRDVGRYQTEQTALWLERTLVFRESCMARRRDVRFVDLEYRGLNADPIGALRRIYDAAELELAPDVVDSFERHRASSFSRPAFVIEGQARTGTREVETR
jgi:hypothetical protein